jgi:Arc-like DNA binding dprotein
MEKRKRAPGGGRRPGELGKLGEVISLRLPEKLKAKLHRAAVRNGRTLNAEVVWRLNKSVGTEGPDFIIPLVRKLDAMSYEIGTMVIEAKQGLGLKSMLAQAKQGYLLGLRSKRKK